jgi:hypothetical protein
MQRDCNTSIMTIRKYENDDNHSWAVFRKCDINHLRGVVFRGQAQPLVQGLSRMDARLCRLFLESLEHAE